MNSLQLAIPKISKRSAMCGNMSKGNFGNKEEPPPPIRTHMSVVYLKSCLEFPIQSSYPNHKAIAK